MKKLLCLFLMLWLPVSASAAWAMSTQMQVNTLSGLAAEITAINMPCHEMGIDQTSPAHDQQPGVKHNCSACGACFIVVATGTPVTMYFSSAALSSRAALPADDQTTSQTYPPALRPPIAS